MEEQKHFVYIVRCADETLYTGYTVDVVKRVQVHNDGKGAKYTRSRLPVTLAACWEFETKRAALQAEFRFKHLSRQAKLQLIHEKAQAPQQMSR